MDADAVVDRIMDVAMIVAVLLSYCFCYVVVAEMASANYIL